MVTLDNSTKYLKELTPFLHNLFHKIEKGKTLPNIFHKAYINLITIPDENSTKEEN